jgi:membrane protease YdiL (CAAX protease family)
MDGTKSGKSNGIFVPAAAYHPETGDSSQISTTAKKTGARKDGYFAISRRPWPGLLLLAPMILFYEVGTLLLNTDRSGSQYRIVAFRLIESFTALVGASGLIMPGLLCIAVLLGWHLAAGDPWKVRRRVLIGMVIEAAILTLPLIWLNNVLRDRVMPVNSPAEAVRTVKSAPSHDEELTPVSAGVNVNSPGWGSEIVFSLGAGIYEELVFRLLLISGLTIILVDILGGHEVACGFFSVIASSILFAAYHHWPGGEPFMWYTFCFRTLAGLYFGGVYVLRGFGITACCHGIYDIIAVTVAHLAF